ncbi:hypothetical protein KIMC2_02420 [Xylocopilactobacillus apis]|uniref:ABC transporter permease n=2 Tax=Xylocopilactobacillus apis TaxID=2932183 RepID=A0AAU9D7N5_9LACO|nr:hypothetical protein KIMC2_02420 [Xylocopilactobacillus apis]
MRLLHPDGKLAADDVPFQASGGQIDSYLKGKEMINRKLLQYHLKPESTRYGTSGSLFIISVLNYLTSFIGIAVVTWYAIRAVSKKYEGNQHRWFETTPIANWKVVLGDYLTFILNSLGFLAVTLGLSLVITTILGQKFHGNYPILIRTIGGAELIPAVFYIIQVVIIYLLVLTVSFIVSYFFVRLVKRSLMSVLISTLILSFGFMFSTEYLTDSYNPLLYQQPTLVFTGRGTDKVNDDLTYFCNGGDDDFEYMLRDFTFENVKYYQGESLGYQLELGLSVTKGAISLTCLILLLLGFLLFPYRNFYWLIKGAVK